MPSNANDANEIGQPGAPGSVKPLPPSYSQIFQKESELGGKKTSVGGSNRSMVDVRWSTSQKDAEANHHVQSGYGVLITAAFIIGEMVGGGIVSMPNAVFRQGWIGIAIIIIVGTLSGYTGVQLGRVWMILQNRWPDVYRNHHIRKPYPEMGFRAGSVVGHGSKCRLVVSICMTISLFGTATVFLLLASRNISGLIMQWSGTNMSFCYWVLIVAAVLTPVTFLGSPKDFWQVSFGAAGATTIAVIIMIIGMSMDLTKKDETVKYPAPTFVSFILGYGTMMFAYSGQCAFPTIQHDMKEPAKFPKAIIISYAVIFFYYLPVSILGYLTYGSKLDDESVLLHLPSGWISQTTVALITLHVLFGFIIFINPINQELENAFNIPTTFTWKRLVVRTAVVVVIVFIAETIPAFNVILDLIGGTTMAFLTFVFPGLFYILLRWRTVTPVDSADTPIQKWEYPVNAVIIIIGILGAVASVYAAVMTIVTADHLFKKPCYINGGES